MSTNVIQMKISLDYIEPEIWRRFIVDDSISLHKLHEVVQIVMGWTDSHLHSFTIRKTDYQPPNPYGDSDFIGFGPAPKNSQNVRLSTLSFRPRQKFRYTYDFGDNWDHTILVEKIFSPRDDTRTPLCLEGKRNCPPEDCGSIPGYERITELIKKKSRTEDDEELLEWLGDEYDPEFFDIEDTNAALRPTKCIKSKTRTIKSGGKKTGK